MPQDERKWFNGTVVRYGSRPCKRESARNLRLRKLSASCALMRQLPRPRAEGLQPTHGQAPHRVRR